MARRKDRIPVVLDTNVIVSALLSINKITREYSAGLSLWSSHQRAAISVRWTLRTKSVNQTFALASVSLLS